MTREEAIAEAERISEEARRNLRSWHRKAPDHNGFSFVVENGQVVVRDSQGFVVARGDPQFVKMYEEQT